MIYNHVPLKYAEYDVKSVVESIEKTHPKNVKADHIIMVTRAEYSKGVLKTKRQNKEDRKEAKRYNALIDAKD